MTHQKPTKQSAFRTQTIRGGGVNLTADLGGDPSWPAVVLLHGGGQTRHSWGGLAVELVSRGYHVVNVDARGHGESDWHPEGQYGFAAMSGDVQAVVGTLQHPPALVGASMGGIASLTAVGETKEAFARALVLVDIVPKFGAGVKKIKEFMLSRPEGFADLEDAADAVAAYNSHRPRPKNNDGLMKNLRKRDDGRLHWHWDPKLLAHDVTPQEFEQRLLAAAEKVRIPTLLVRGLQSDVVNDDGVEQLREHLKGLEVYDVAEAGHMVAGDKNDVFNTGVVDFLARHMPPAKVGG